jgi:glycerol kinase
LLQATADLVQLPLQVYPSPHATPLGAAALARLAVEPDLSLEDAVAGWSPVAVVEPRWSTDRAEGFRARWRAAVDAALPNPID